MSDDKQIQEIKNNFVIIADPTVRKRAFDALGSFGTAGIDAINELIFSNAANLEKDVIAYGFEVIAKIKKPAAKDDSSPAKPATDDKKS